MNAPKPIAVTVPNSCTGRQALKMLVDAGIPALLVTKKFNRLGPVKKIEVDVGSIRVWNNGPTTRHNSHTYEWTPPAYEPRPMFQANDAERFVILARFICQSRAEIDDPKDPLMAAMVRIFAEEDEDVPAPGIDHIRGIIDRAVIEAGGAR